MKTLDKGQDKIKKICNTLRQETLEPAKAEAEQILEDARKNAERILQETRGEAEQLLKGAHERIEQERNVFQSSLEQAGRQGVESLRQAIETELFNPELSDFLAEGFSDPKVVSRVVDVIIAAIEKDGIDTDLQVVIPKAAKPEEIAKLLTSGVSKRLSAGAIRVGDFAGGAQVRLVDKKMTIDLSDEALKEVLSRYVRKDFRQLLFGSSS